MTFTGLVLEAAAWVPLTSAPLAWRPRAANEIAITSNSSQHGLACFGDAVDIDAAAEVANWTSRPRFSVTIVISSSFLRFACLFPSSLIPRSCLLVALSLVPNSPFCSLLSCSPPSYGALPFPSFRPLLHASSCTSPVLKRLVRYDRRSLSVAILAQELGVHA